MKKLKNILILNSFLLSIIFIFLLMFLTYWYIISFHNYKKDIDFAIKETKLELGEDVSQIYNLSTIAYRKYELLSLVARLGLLKFKYNNSEHKHFFWALNKALWQVSIKFWYSEKEIFYI